MAQENRELLFKDLCGRVPYEVIVCIDGVTNVKLASVSYWEEVEVQDGSRYLYDISDIKPYLFPLSSMTEEQKEEYNRWKHEVPVCHYEYGDVVEEVELFDSPESFEYLIENHFDYRGLIEKGLAIDCTNLNIY